MPLLGIPDGGGGVHPLQTAMDAPCPKAVQHMTNRLSIKCFASSSYKGNATKGSIASGATGGGQTHDAVPEPVVKGTGKVDERALTMWTTAVMAMRANDRSVAGAVVAVPALGLKAATLRAREAAKAPNPMRWCKWLRPF